MAHVQRGVAVKVKKAQKKQGGRSKSNPGRNEKPSRVRYRARFFEIPMGRKALKIAARKGQV